MATTKISNNSLAFMALSNEYCQTLEGVADSSRDIFVADMLRLLPRIYITATDLDADSSVLEECYLEPRLEEDYYDAIRRGVENLLGSDDTYLEVFEEDMKYSDTPIAASVAEGLADIFQTLYNFLDGVRDMPEDVIMSQLAAVKDEFREYWGQTLCNLLRPLNNLRYSAPIHDEE